jgi:predicted Zn-dependent protease
MRDHRFIPGLAAGLALSASLLACDVSQEDEVALGANTAEQIEAQLPIVDDAAVDGYINALGDSIALLTSRADLDWHFYVVNSSQVNAFALPGGWVYVNRGLIERSTNLSELAGALGHEIGHVVLRHGVDRMKKSTGTNVAVALLCTLTQFCDNPIGQVAVRAGGSALLASYSRQDEREADSDAVQNVLRAGIHPGGIPSLFRTLMEERERRPFGVEAWFTTHPLEESRIQETRQMIDALDAAALADLRTDSQQYQAFRAHLLALPPAPEPPPADTR